MGCGGAPDLMSFEYLGYGEDVEYCGFDKNNYWEKVHNFIEDNFTEGTAEFYRDIDVLTYFDNNIYAECNVLIIQYLISFFYGKIGEKGLRKWFEQLVDNVVSYKSEDPPC